MNQCEIPGCNREAIPHVGDDKHLCAAHTQVRQERRDAWEHAIRNHEGRALKYRAYLLALKRQDMEEFYRGK